MSGGSFNHLYGKDLALDHSGGGMCDLEEMVAVLEREHGGTRAAINARALLDGMRNLDKLKQSLSRVFQAIEWVHSGDSMPGDADDEVARYEVTP